MGPAPPSASVMMSGRGTIVVGSMEWTLPALSPCHNNPPATIGRMSSTDVPTFALGPRMSWGTVSMDSTMPVELEKTRRPEGSMLRSERMTLVAAASAPAAPPSGLKAATCWPVPT